MVQLPTAWDADARHNTDAAEIESIGASDTSSDGFNSLPQCKGKNMDASWKWDGQRCCQKQAYDGSKLLCWPTMIVTGAAKGGSTLFSTYMVQHPKFHHAQPKELHQFSQLEDVIPHRYLKAFGYQEEGDGILSGENTPVYMFEEATMRRMAESAPFMKLILVLRHPTDRAYSEYNMYMDIEAQGQLSRDWFHSVLDELIECMDRVHRTHNNGQPGAKYEFPTDMCLGEFPKKTVTWNHLLMVRDAFRNENALPMARRGRYTRCLKAKRDFGESSLGFF